MFHNRWSRRVAQPVGNAWGDDGVGGVAQCMVWNYGYPPRPAQSLPAPYAKYQRENVPARLKETAKPTNTSVSFEPNLAEIETSRITGEMQARRPTPPRGGRPNTANATQPNDPPPLLAKERTILREDMLLDAMKECARTNKRHQAEEICNGRPPTGYRRRVYRQTKANTDLNASFQPPVGLQSTGALVALRKPRNTLLARPSSAPSTGPQLNGEEQENTTYNFSLLPRPASRNGSIIGRPAFKPAGGKDWRPSTPGNPRDLWRLQKFTKNARPKVVTAWQDGERGVFTKQIETQPGKINFEMNCPEDSDMIINIRVRTTSANN